MEEHLCQPTDIGEEINYTYRHYSHSTYLTEGIAGKTHKQWEDGSTEETHNHQSTHLVLLIRHSKQSLRENHGEDIRVTISHQGDGDIKHRLALAYPHTYHTQSHHYNADNEESAGLHHAEEDCTGETSNGTEDKVERC